MDCSRGTSIFFLLFNRPVLFTTLRPTSLISHVLAGNPCQVGLSWDVLYAGRDATSLLATQYRGRPRAEEFQLTLFQIQGRTTLRALIQVCRVFREIFEPFLYRQRILQLHKYPASQLLEKALPAHLRHTKEFQVIFSDFRDGGVTYNIEMNDGYALSIARMLKAMPNLRSFRYVLDQAYTQSTNVMIRWSDGSFETGHSPSLILRNEKFLTTLKGCKTLSKLSIQWRGQYEYDDVEEPHCSIPLTGFRNLTSLELYELSGIEDGLIRDISRVLSSSPYLKKLGLGLAYECDAGGTPEILIVRGNATSWKNYACNSDTDNNQCRWP